MSDNKNFDVLFKILLIGDMGVGKSCLLIRYSDNQFNAAHVSTIGVDFKIRTIVKDGKTIKLQIWDTAGQERFRTITTSYYKGAHGVIMVYDITKKDTFTNLNDWLHDVRTYAAEEIGILLVGNKVDLEDQREVSTEEGDEWSKKLNVPFLETSAKEKVNVEQAFEKMVDEVFQKVFSNQITSGDKKEPSVALNNKPKKKKSPCTLL